MQRRPSFPHLITVFATTSLALCACGEVEPPTEDFRGSKDNPWNVELTEDAQTHAYRVYQLSEADGVRTVDRSDFDGVLAMPRLTPEQFEALRKDSDGNLSTGWIADGPDARRMLLSPDYESFHAVAHAPDGTVSSSIDADGDGVADLVDIAVPGLPRTLIVTEALGLGLLESWRAGFDPFCFDTGIQGFAAASFGCPEEQAGGGGGSGVQPSPSDIADIFCSNYAAGPQFFDAPVHAHGDRYRRPAYNEPDSAHDDEGRLSAMRVTTVRYDNEGNHAHTVRNTAYTDGHNNIVRTVHEYVRPDGTGRRTITDIAPDGTRKVHEEDFETEVYDNNNFPDYDHTPGADEGDPPPDWGNDPEQSPSSWDDRPPDVGDPKPGGANPGGYPPPEPDADEAMEEFCAMQTGNNPSGVEQAVASNVTDIKIDCEDFVINPASTGTGDSPLCGTIWSAHNVFDPLTDGDVPTNDCGPYMMPGPDGTCGERVVNRFRGGVARVELAELDGITLCDPLVCNPGNF